MSKDEKLEVEKRIRGFLEIGHKLDKADEILTNLDSSSEYLRSVKTGKSTATTSLNCKVYFSSYFFKVYIFQWFYLLSFYSYLIGLVIEKGQASGGGQAEAPKSIRWWQISGPIEA